MEKRPLNMSKSLKPNNFMMKLCLLQVFIMLILRVNVLVMRIGMWDEEKQED